MSVSDSLTRNVLSGLFPNDPRAVKAFEQLTFATDDTAALASSMAAATGALQDATFLTLSANDGAPNERVLKIGHGLASDDDGSFLTLSLGLGAAIVDGGYSVTLRSQGVTDLILPFSGTLATLDGQETLKAKTLAAPSLSGLGNYANDAGASAGGVPVGGMYRNGSVLQVRVT